MQQQTVTHHLLLKLGATVKVAPFLRSQFIQLIDKQKSMKELFNTDMRLSEHFTLKEMLVSSKAANHKPEPIPNIPLKCHITALQNLVDRTLEPLREHLGLPIQVNSGYRCEMVNKLVGGVPTSQHLKGEAADITIPRSSRPFAHATDEQAARLIYCYAKEYADYDQLILEHSGTSWWVHISCKIDYLRNRHEKLMIENGRTKNLD